MTDAKKGIPEVFAGIDGGGTKTDITVLDSGGRIVFSGSYGPSNMLNGDEFEITLQQAFRDILSKLSRLYIGRVRISMMAGFAGTLPGESGQRLRDVFEKSSIGHSVATGSVKVLSDALLALNVYFPESEGILLVAGTGSICFGKDPEGKIFTTGGFGYLIDDAGSGFWFGKQALKAALRSYYRQGGSALLEQLVTEHFKLSKAEDVLGMIYRENSRSLIASASPLVFSAADSGCKVSEEIIGKGAEELTGLVRSCSGLINNSSSCVMLHGSVFKQPRLAGLIREQLKDRMNVYLSDKRIDLQAANRLLDESSVSK